MDTVNALTNTIELLSLISVFAFVLFDMRYPQIMKALEKDAPQKELEVQTRLAREEVTQIIWAKSVPLVIVFGILSYLLLPSAFFIFENSHFELWNFELELTLFILLTLFIWGFFIWAMFLLCRLMMKKKNIGR